MIMWCERRTKSDGIRYSGQASKDLFFEANAPYFCITSSLSAIYPPPIDFGDLTGFYSGVTRRHL